MRLGWTEAGDFRLVIPIWSPFYNLFKTFYVELKRAFFFWQRAKSFASMKPPVWLAHTDDFAAMAARIPFLNMFNRRKVQKQINLRASPSWHASWT
jgi:hypothetical protein